MRENNLEICDDQGNLCDGFLTRLESLKTQQAKNINELEKLRIDAKIEKRKIDEKNEQTNEIIVDGDIENTEDSPETKFEQQVNEHIYEMWRDFNLTKKINDTNFSGGKDIYKGSDPIKAESGKQWSPIITVPRPFSMTIRAEAKGSPGKHSRTSIAIARAKADKERLEQQEMELKRQFKARPAPPETTYPLYHDIVTQSQNRRKVVTEQRKAELHHIIKPFSFAERDARRARLKAQQICAKQDAEDRLVKIISNNFKATDLDKSILENTLNLGEDDNERQQRIRERSEKLLRSASAGRLDPSLSKTKVNKGEESANTVVKAHPVPDFTQLHKRNAENMRRTKQRAETRRNKRPKSAAPTLYSSKRAALKPKPEEEKIDNNFKRTRILFVPEPTPVKENEVFARRKKFINETLSLLESQVELEKMANSARKKKSRDRARQLQKKLPKSSSHSHEYSNQLKQESQERQKEYRRTLNKIYQKVDSRPLLFEQM